MPTVEGVRDSGQQAAQFGSPATIFPTEPPTPGMKADINLMRGVQHEFQ